MDAQSFAESSFARSGFSFFPESLHREASRHPRDDAQRIAEPREASSRGVDLCRVLLWYTLPLLTRKEFAGGADAADFQHFGAAALQMAQQSALNAVLLEVRSALYVTAYCSRTGWIIEILSFLRRRSKSRKEFGTQIQLSSAADLPRRGTSVVLGRTRPSMDVDAAASESVSKLDTDDRASPSDSFAGDSRAWLLVDGLLLDLVETIARYSINPHELEALLEAACDPNMTEHWPRCMQILSNLASDVPPRPTLFFDFSGNDAGLLLPPMGLPTGGFSFATWLRVESFKSGQTTLLSLYDANGFGFRAFFEQNIEPTGERVRTRSRYDVAATATASRRLCFESTVQKGATQGVTFDFAFEPKRWVHVAVILRAHMIWKDEASLIVDGTLVATVHLPFPRSVGRLTQARLATNPTVASLPGEPEDARGDPSFFGQMTTVLFFAEPLTVPDVKEICQLGVNAFSGRNAHATSVLSSLAEHLLFQPEELNPDDGPRTRGQRGDCFLFARRVVPLWMAFSPGAVDGQICINTCTLLPQDAAASMPGVLQRKCEVFPESLAAIGGLVRLFLLLVPSDRIEALSDAYARSVDPVVVQKSEASWIPHDNRTTPSTSASNRSGMFSLDPAPFFDLLLALGETNSLALQRDLTQSCGLHVLGYLLDTAVAAQSITLKTTRSMAAFLGFVLSKFGTTSTLYGDALRNILLNWRIWYMCSEPVQQHVLQVLQAQVRARPSFFYTEVGLEYFVGLLRLFFWLQQPDAAQFDPLSGGTLSVTSECLAQRLPRDKLVHLRAVVLQIAGAMMEGVSTDAKSHSVQRAGSAVFTKVSERGVQLESKSDSARRLRSPNAQLSRNGSSILGLASALLPSKSSGLMSLCTEEVACLCSYLSSVLGHPSLDGPHDDSSFEAALSAAAASRSATSSSRYLPDAAEALDVVAVFGPAMLRYFEAAGERHASLSRLESPEQLLRLWKTHAVSQSSRYPHRPFIPVVQAYDYGAVEELFVRALFDLRRDSSIATQYEKLDMSENANRMHKRVILQRRGTSHYRRKVVPGEEEALEAPMLPSALKRVRQQQHQLLLGDRTTDDCGLCLAAGLTLLRPLDPLCVRREGFLIKKGRKRKSWKTRYFVLFQSVLTYKDGGGQQRGCLNLSAQPTASVAIRECAEIKGGNQHLAYCFELDVASPEPRTYFLAARTRNEMEEWMRDILAAVPNDARVPRGASSEVDQNSSAKPTPWHPLFTNVHQERLDVSQHFLPSDSIVHKAAAGYVDVLDEIAGVLEFTMTDLYWFALDGSVRHRWPLSRLVCVYRRPYLLRNSALEVFLMENRSIFLNFYRNEDCVKALGKLLALRPPRLVNRATLAPEGLVVQTKITQMWCSGNLSNFDYIMALNTLAGRSYRCVNQYPVFPWVLSDYTSDELDLQDPRVYRDLSKPMGALNEDRLAGFKDRYAQFEDVFKATIDAGGADHNGQPLDIPPPFHYGTHYSNNAGVLSYLMRLEPFTTAFAQLGGGKFDRAERMFLSVAHEWHSATTTTSNVKELVPEFFYLPEVLRCHNSVDFGTHSELGPVRDVVLPPWAKGSPEEFVRLMRKALESEYVSIHLHEWIDLIFGFKQSGEAAKEAFNVFHYLTYHGSVDVEAIEDPVQRRSIEAQILNFGLCPMQLFNHPHPPRTQLPGGLASVADSKKLAASQSSEDLTQVAAHTVAARSSLNSMDLSQLTTLSRDLSQNAVPEGVLSLIVAMLLDADTGLDIRTRRHRLVPYHNCFVGAEAVTWFLVHLKLRSRAEAVALGQLLTVRGIIRHVNDEHGFKDKNVLYRFAISDSDHLSATDTVKSKKDPTDLPRLNDDMPAGYRESTNVVDGEPLRGAFRIARTKRLVSNVYTFPVLPKSRACPVISLMCPVTTRENLIAVYADGTVAVNRFTLVPDGRGSPFTFEVDRSAANPSTIADAYSGLSGAKRVRMAILRDAVRTPSACFALAGDRADVLLTCGNPDQSFCAFQLSVSEIRPSFVVAGEHHATVTALAVDRDTLVTASNDMMVCVWDISAITSSSGSAGSEFSSIGEAGLLHLRHRLWGHRGQLTCVAVRCDEDMVASASADGTCVLHSLRRGKYLRTLRYGAHDGSPHELDAVGSGLAQGSHEPTCVRITSNALLITACAVREESQRFATGASIHVHTLNGVRIAFAMEEFAHVHDMALSDDGNFVVTCGPEHVVIRQVPQLTLVRRFRVPSVVHSVCLSPDGYFIFAGLQDGQLQVLPMEKLAIA